MAKLIPAAERIARARALIQEAREFSVPEESVWSDFSYIAQVKDRLQKARDLVKFISYTPSATPEIKNEVKQIYLEAEQAEKELLHP